MAEQPVEESLQEAVWLKYLREVVRLAREAADQDSGSDGDSSGGSSSSGSAGREPQVSLEDFEVGRGVRCSQCLRSAWEGPTLGCCSSCCQAGCMSLPLSSILKQLIHLPCMLLCPRTLQLLRAAWVREVACWAGMLAHWF